MSPTSAVIRKAPQPANPQLACYAQDLRQLQLAVRDGTAAEKFPVGTEIYDVWRDAKSCMSYDAPLIVVDYRDLKTSSTRIQPCATLLRKYLAPITTCFDVSGGNPQYCETEIDGFLGHPQRHQEEMYVAGCSQELLKVISPVIIYTYEVDGDDRQCLVGHRVDKFFIPGEVELNFAAEQYSASGEVSHTWEYFRGARPYYFQGDLVKEWREKRTFCDNNGTPQSFWLRDHYPRSRGQRQYSEGGRAFTCSNKSLHYILPACVVA